jgi:hypothetical protein
VLVIERGPLACSSIVGWALPPAYMINMTNDPHRCPYIPRCELVRSLRSENTLRFCQDRYCHGDFRSCARFEHFERSDTRPPDSLLPNGQRRRVTG